MALPPQFTKKGPPQQAQQKPMVGMLAQRIAANKKKPNTAKKPPFGK